jgi:hypothetical protein
MSSISAGVRDLGIKRGKISFFTEDTDFILEASFDISFLM